MGDKNHIGRVGCDIHIRHRYPSAYRVGKEANTDCDSDMPGNRRSMESLEEVCCNQDNRMAAVVKTAEGLVVGSLERLRIELELGP